ncbi:MAG: outer membrane beta-barrel protein [Bacteroidota bacterium]
MKKLLLVFGLLIAAIAAFSQPRGGFDRTEMVKREKENVLSKVQNLTADQKLLIDGIYDEYGVTMGETFEEIRKSGDFSQFRTKMPALQKEKDLLIKDVLRDDQYIIYENVIAGGGLGMGGARNQGEAQPEENKSEANPKPSTITGTIMAVEDGSGLPGATVLMINVKDSARSKFATALPDGSFTVTNLEQAFYKMRVTSLGYKPMVRVLRVNTDINMGNVPLAEDIKELQAVEIKGDVVPVEKKGDTTLYNADAYKVNPDASAADLVRKLPGMTITDAGVQSNGETVSQVLLDGKRFFGQDPVLALNTIPAEVVKKVEVFDQMSERSQFTGFDDGNTTKTLNVVTREDKRDGIFGKLTAGYGTDDRHNVEGNINFMKDGRQLTILGMTNDINKKNFSDGSIMGSSGGGRGFGRSFGGGQNLTPTGITQTQSVGVNFSDTWAKKGRIESSYFFDRSLFDNHKVTGRESFFGGESLFYDEDATSHTENLNHRMNMRLQYNLNDKNSILFRPNISFQDGESLDVTFGQTFDQSQQLINGTDNTYSGDNLGYRIDGQLTWNHKFDKTGRTFSVELGTNVNNTNRENIYSDNRMDSLFRYDNTDENVSWSTGFNYTEPVGLSGQLNANYELSNYVRRNIRDGFSYNSFTVNSQTFEEGLSSHFDTDYTTHKPSIGLRNRSLTSFYGIDLAYQYVALDSRQGYPSEIIVPTNKFNNVLPSLMSRLDLGKERSLFMRYSTSTNIPSAQQLQQVVDNSNPLFMSVGNPYLDQSYSHQMFARYSKTNTEKNTNFSNFVMASTTQDFITNATYRASADSTLVGDIVLPRGGQITQPVNLNGYWNVRDNITYGFLVSPLKTNVNLTLGAGYTRTPGLANRISNISQTYNGNTGVNLSSNISKNVDFNVSYSLGLNKVTNSVQANSNTSYKTHLINGKINLISKAGTVFRSDINYQIYDGGSGNFNTSYILWNVSIAQKFLKNDMGELSLTVFDLLNQNQSITQNITSAYFEEVRSLVLQQYFMLSFTYTLRKFSKGTKN